MQNFAPTSSIHLDVAKMSVFCCKKETLGIICKDSQKGELLSIVCKNHGELQLKEEI
jgi:hypothetical protein